MEETIESLREQVANLKAAASSAAGTAVTAIERIQELQRVVDAAIAWEESMAKTADAHYFDEPIVKESFELFDRLRQETRTHLERVRSRS